MERLSTAATANPGLYLGTRTGTTTWRAGRARCYFLAIALASSGRPAGAVSPARARRIARLVAGTAAVGRVYRWCCWTRRINLASVSKHKANTQACQQHSNHQRRYQEFERSHEVTSFTMT